MYPSHEVAVPAAPQIVATGLQMAQKMEAVTKRRGWGACSCGRCGSFRSGHVDQNLCANCGCPFSSHAS
jgi:ribosomal protein L37E